MCPAWRLRSCSAAVRFCAGRAVRADPHAFIPSAGRKLIVSDFSAVEARVIAWLAGEQWRMEVFAHGGDIYCASASQMFGVLVEIHGVNGHLRQKGKIAELALGYGGSVGALKAMGTLEAMPSTGLSCISVPLTRAT